MANEDGVWRTIGGRRIFIKKGQRVSEAMKESGKFKTNKSNKTPDYDKRPESDIDKENRKNNRAVEAIEKGKDTFDPVEFEKWRQKEDPNFEMDDDRARHIYELRGQPKVESSKENLKGANREEQKKINENYIKEQSKLANEKESRQELTKEYKKYSDSTGSMSDDAFTEKARELGMSDEEIAKQIYAKHDGPESNTSSDNNIKRLLAKQKKEESLAKSDKETADRFERYEKEFESRTSQASSKSYKASDLEEGKPYEIDMGNGIKKTAIYLGKDEDGNSSFYDGEGISGTFGFSDKFINDRLKISDNKDDDKFMELHNQIKGSQKQASSNNDWVRDAFNQYKKDHPGTKMTLANFKKSNLK